MLIDFIDLSDDDIIDLSSGDETVQEDQIATHHRATLLDIQSGLVVAGEGSEDEQVVFVAASEGRQETVECGHALEATTSFMFTEKAPLVAASEGSQDVQAVFVAASEGSKDVQAVFVAAGEGSQGVQAVIVAASEGRQDTAECGHALVATTSFLVTEKAPLGAASEGSEDVQAVFIAAGEASQDVQAVFVAAGEGSQDAQAVLVAASEGRQEAAECGHALEAFLVTEKAPLVAASEGSQDMQAVFVAASEGGEDEQAAFVAVSEGSQDVQAMLVAASEGRQEPVDSGNALEATTSSLVTEKEPLDMAESQNCPRSPTSAPFPSSISTTLKALTSEGEDAKLVRRKVIHPRKNCHTGTPRISPRFEPKPECCNGPVEEMPDEALTSEGGDVELVRVKDYHTGTPRTSPRFELNRECHNGPVEELLAEALTSEDGNAKLVKGKVKHPRVNYHTSTPRTSPRFEPKPECCNGPVEELPAEALTPEDGNAKLVRLKVKHPRMNYHTSTPRTSPRFEPKPESLSGPVEELPAEALTPEDGNTKLVRGRVKHPRVNYHTSTPRTSPRLEPKPECRNGPVEELPAENLISEGGDEELVRGNVKHPRVKYHTSTPRKSPRFEPKPECRNGPVEELPAKTLTSEGGDEELVRGNVKNPRKNYHTGTPRISPRFEPKPECRNGPVEELPAEALTSQDGDAKLVKGKVKHPRFEPKPECRNGLVEELPAEALTSEDGDAKLVKGKVKHPRKKYHTSTPRTSPRFVPKLECHNGHVEELPAEALDSEGGNEELVRGKVKHPGKKYQTGTPRTSPRFVPKLECHNGHVEELPTEALTSECADAELVRGKGKQPTKKYHTGTPRTSRRFVLKLECHNGHVEELPTEALTSEGADVELVRVKGKHRRKNYHTGTPRTSPTFEQKLDCHNGHVEELPAEVLASEGADAELVRMKVKHTGKDYHTGTPRTSPRFVPKRERRNGPVEELAADHKRFRTLEELIASPDNAECAKPPSTDPVN